MLCLCWLVPWACFSYSVMSGRVFWSADFSVLPCLYCLAVRFMLGFCGSGALFRQKGVRQGIACFLSHVYVGINT